MRLVQLAGGPALIPADDRFAGFPTALVTHIIGAAVFALVGMFQFVPGSAAGTSPGTAAPAGSLAVAGLAVAGSALWLTLFYEAQPGTGDLLYVLRLVFGSAMVGCVVLGFTAVRRRDIAAHRAWMIRAYAIGLAAGTQVFTEGIGGAVFGTGVLAGDLAKGAGWVINLAVAEWVIRRPAVPPAPPPNRVASRTRWSTVMTTRPPPPRRTRSASTATSTTTGRPGSATSCWSATTTAPPS